MRRRTGQHRHRRLSQRQDSTARASSRANPSHILRAAINRHPADWRCQAGRPRWTWIHTINSTFRLITLVSAQHGSVHRVAWTAVSFWRRLCSLLGAILNDDDKMHIDMVWYTRVYTHLTNMFPDHLGMQHQNATILDFIEAEMIEVVTAGVIRRAKLQSNHYHQHTFQHTQIMVPDILN